MIAQASPQELTETGSTLMLPLIGRDAGPKPVSAKVTWRDGSNARLTSHCAAVRVRPAHRDHNRTSPWPEEW